MINISPASREKTYELATYFVVIFVFMASLFFAPFYSEGDQALYNRAYEAIKNSSLIEAFLAYQLNIGSTELGHFVIILATSWLGLEKFLVMAFANGLIVFFLMKLFNKWQVSIFVACVICITNFYLLVLYFAAERLKFGFLFFIISIYYISNKKKSFVFSFLAVITHLQLTIFYVTLLFPKFLRIFIKSSIRFFLTLNFKFKGIFLPFLMLVTLVSLIWMILGNQMLSKFYFYSTYINEKNDSLGLLRSMLFFIMSLFYTKNRMNVVLKFIPLIIAIFLVGGDRLNLFAYAIFMSYALTYKRGLNYGVLFSTIYFANKSVDFIINIIETGQGY